MKALERLKKLNTNNKIVLKNTVFAFLVKGAALVISFLTTPAFIRYFDDNAVLGVWYTMLSVLMWFLNFDLGIGNGIRNNLVKDLTVKDYDGAKRTLSSGMFSIAVVTAVLFAVGVVLVQVIDLNWMFNIEKDIISYKTLMIATLLVLFGIMLRFFLTSVSAVFYAMQMSSVNNFLTLCVSVLQLLFVLVVKPASAEQGLVLLSAAYAVISNLPMVVAGVVVFCGRMRMCRPSWRYIEKAYTKRVLGVGTVFFACQILYMLIVNTNEFLVTNQFGPAYTTEYTFYYKLTSLISMAISLGLTPIWSVVTKAMAEKNYIWLNKLYRTLKLVGLAAVAVQFGFILCQQFVMDLWLGDKSIQVNYATAVAFACFGSVFIYSTILSTIVCGMARMRLQMICYLVGVAVKFSLIFSLAPIVQDWVIVVWSNALILLPYCVAQQIDLDRYLGGLAKQQAME